MACHSTIVKQTIRTFFRTDHYCEQFCVHKRFIWASAPMFVKLPYSDAKKSTCKLKLIFFYFAVQKTAVFWVSFINTTFFFMLGGNINIGKFPSDSISEVKILTYIEKKIPNHYRWFIKTIHIWNCWKSESLLTYDHKIWQCTYLWKIIIY